MVRDVTIDPALWQNLLLLAGERAAKGRSIGSWELTVLCGIPKEDSVLYLEEMGRVLGWEDEKERCIIPINPDGSDRIMR